MNKLVLFSTLAAATAAAVVLTPMAAGAIAGHYQGGQDNSQAVRARDGSGVGVQAGIQTQTQTQDRQYVHLADGTCDGTGAGDGTGVGAQQRMHGRE